MGRQSSSAGNVNGTVQAGGGVGVPAAPGSRVRDDGKPTTTVRLLQDSARRERCCRRSAIQDGRADLDDEKVRIVFNSWELRLLALLGSWVTEREIGGEAQARLWFRASGCPGRERQRLRANA